MLCSSALTWLTCSNAAACASGSGQCHSPRSSAAAARICCSSAADSAVCCSDALMIASTRRATVLANVDNLQEDARCSSLACRRGLGTRLCHGSTTLYGLRSLLVLRGCLIMPQRQPHPEALVKVQDVVCNHASELRPESLASQLHTHRRSWQGATVINLEGASCPEMCVQFGDAPLLDSLLAAADPEADHAQPAPRSTVSSLLPRLPPLSAYVLEEPLA